MTSSLLRRIALASTFVSSLLPFACDSDEPSPSEPQGGSAGAAPATAGSAGSSSAGSPAGGSSSQPQGGAAGEPPIAGSGGSTAGEAAGGVGGESGTDDLPPVTDPMVLPLTGDIQDVHDPFIVREGDTYYLFHTGVGVSVRTSTDLLEWSEVSPVFASKPSWITTTDPGNPNHLWAPEVRFFGGAYHLYYSASKFGSNQSCIGHATRTSLASGKWTDQGSAVLCSNVGAGPHNYNAIDPNPFVDEDGNAWLAFGSFWSGLKLVRLDQDGHRDGPDLFSLSTRNNSAVEAPSLHYHDGFYYLFESVDSCCQGVNSTYKMMVGRAATVSGPYVDKNGIQLMNGGGLLLVTGGARWRGPGHNAILSDRSRLYNVYHSYDAEDGGVPTLRIADLIWDDDGWPVSAGP